MMEESDKMIEDSSERLGKAVGELKDLVVSVILVYSPCLFMPLFRSRPRKTRLWRELRRSCRQRRLSKLPLCDVT